MTTINETNDNPVRLSIGMRINQVRKQVEYIKKEKRVAAYKAVEHDQVTAMLRPSLIEHGIITVVKEIKGELASTEKQTDKGVPILTRIYEIGGVKQKDKVNNKVANDFVGEIVDMKVGFFCGIPIE